MNNNPHLYSIDSIKNDFGFINLNKTDEKVSVSRNLNDDFNSFELQKTPLKHGGI